MAAQVGGKEDNQPLPKSPASNTKILSRTGQGALHTFYPNWAKASSKGARSVERPWANSTRTNAAGKRVANTQRNSRAAPGIVAEGRR